METVFTQKKTFKVQEKRFKQEKFGYEQIYFGNSIISSFSKEIKKQRGFSPKGSVDPNILDLEHKFFSFQKLIGLRMPMVRLELATPGLQTQCSSH